MRFHLDFQPKKSPHSIQHQEEILFLGSCFSEHIAHKLEQLHFSVNTNAFGIVFNPISIEKILHRIINNFFFNENDVFEKNSLWYCLEAHSAIFGTTKNELIEKLNNIINHWHLKLKNAEWLFITMGSAYGYENIEQKKIVANCHKLPQNNFEKKLLSTETITDAYSKLIKDIHQFNPQLKIIFTVSPVKHLRDGVIENSLSKATLISAVHKLTQSNSSCFYFPAYELVTDDLRDYRFYKEDMAHPNQQAIDYVWQKFSECYFTSETNQLNKQLHEINLAKTHKPLQPDSLAFLEFKKNHEQQCETLMLQYPWLKLKV